MKFTNATLITLCIALLQSSSTVSAARQLKMGMSNRPSTPSSAQKYGDKHASELYKKGKYSCNKGMTDIIDKFWPKVKSKTFRECEKKYKKSSDIQDCKNGAEYFVVDKANDCATLEDCRYLGEVASFDTATQFCSSGSQLTSKRPEFFPPTCRSIAKSRCTDYVVDDVADMASDRQCGKVRKVPKDLKSSDISKLNSMCDAEVEDLAASAQLY